MSQSDYIKYKKVNNILSVDASNNFLPVLNSQDYSDYKEFVLENTVINSKTIYRRITPDSQQIVLDMNKTSRFGISSNAAHHVVAALTFLSLTSSLDSKTFLLYCMYYGSHKSAP
jgi:hypothetical protein